MKYTINKINEDNSVDVTFESDEVEIPTDRATQNISGLTITDVDALKSELESHAQAFCAGLKQEIDTTTETGVPAAVEALIGHAQTVENPEE